MKAGEDVLTQEKIVLGDYELGKEYLNSDNWKFPENNGFIILFLNSLCKYSNPINTEDIEGSVLVSKRRNTELPTIEELKKSFECIEKLCEKLKDKLERDLVKEKLYLFKVIYQINCSLV